MGQPQAAAETPSAQPSGQTVANAFTALPVFNQQGELVALQVPASPPREATDWSAWLDEIARAWHQDFNRDLQFIMTAQSTATTISGPLPRCCAPLPFAPA